MMVRYSGFAAGSFVVRCAPDGGTEVLDAPPGVDIVIR
jgi:hypothetical protein